MATYTRGGANKNVSSEQDDFYQMKIYTKRNLTKAQIDNFTQAFGMDVGISLVKIDYQGGYVKMKG